MRGAHRETHGAKPDVQETMLPAHYALLAFESADCTTQRVMLSVDTLEAVGSARVL